MALSTTVHLAKELHIPSAIRALRATDATTGLAYMGNDPISGLYVYRAKKNTDWTPAQAASLPGLLARVPGPSEPLFAQDHIDGWPIEFRALVLSLLDQINVLRTKAGLAAVTPSQALQAVRDKAATL